MYYLFITAVIFTFRIDECFKIKQYKYDKTANKSLVMINSVKWKDKNIMFDGFSIILLRDFS